MSNIFTTLRRTAIRYLRHGGLDWDEAYLRRQRTHGRWAFIHINKCGGTSVEHALNIPKTHDTARMRRDRLGRDRWDRMATFSIVRHPYARVPSLYKYRIKTDRISLADGHIELNRWVREVFAERNPVYHDKPLMFLPARDWLIDETGEIIVDYVAKLEDIAAAWPKIQQITGSTAALPRKNTTERAAGDSLTAESKAIIDTYFAADFETFGYDR